MVLVLGKSYQLLFQIPSFIFMVKKCFLPKDVLFFKYFTLCFNNLNIDLTRKWYRRTCRYSDGLSMTGKTFAAPFRGFWDILRAVRNSPFLKICSRIFWIRLELSRSFFVDSANKYKDLPFKLLKLDLCANVVIGRKWKEATLNDQNQSVVTSQKSI